MIYCFKRCKCYFACNATYKSTIIKSYIQFKAIGGNVKLLFFTWWFYVVLSQSHWCYCRPTNWTLSVMRLYETYMRLKSYQLLQKLVISILLLSSPLVSLSYSLSLIVDILNQVPISCNSCVTWLLTSSFRTCFFLFTFSLFKCYNILWIKT